MKKLMMIAAMMLAAVTVNAQEAGQAFLKPMVGGTLTTITDIHESKMKFGLVAGAEVGYMFSDKLGLTGGLLYTMQGCKFKEGDDSDKLEYLNVPVLVNYYVAPGFAIKAGAQAGFLMKAKSGDYDFKDACKKVDFSIPVGLSYEFSDFVIDARYNFGLTKIFDDADVKCKNSVIMLTLGYKIPF